MLIPTEWLSYIYDQSPVASAVVRGPEHVYVAANDAYRRAAGTEDVVGRRIVHVFPNVSARSLAGLAEVIATGRTKVIHEQPGRWVRDGEMQDGFVDLIWQPLPGTDSGIIIWGLDVTDQVRAQQSVAALSAERLALLESDPKWSRRARHTLRRGKGQPRGTVTSGRRSISRCQFEIGRAVPAA